MDSKYSIYGINHIRTEYKNKWLDHVYEFSHHRPPRRIKIRVTGDTLYYFHSFVFSPSVLTIAAHLPRCIQIRIGFSIQTSELPCVQSAHQTFTLCLHSPPSHSQRNAQNSLVAFTRAFLIAWLRASRWDTRARVYFLSCSSGVAKIPFPWNISTRTTFYFIAANSISSKSHRKISLRRRLKLGRSSRRIPLPSPNAQKKT